MAGDESLPDVFDRIVDTTRQLHGQERELRSLDPEAQDDIVVRKDSADGGISVVAQPGRLSSIEVDSQKRDETRWAALLKEICEVSNAALQEANERLMDQYREINKEFDSLVSNLPYLQADFRDAFMKSIGQMGLE
ncbi:MAG: hypothetical protein E7L00_04305 [Propionibacteriaceae bacterium]|nr:hypothetical protein [Propionibacteriaceae bacterium]